MRVTVVGAGAWGTALAILLRENSNQVTMWAHRLETIREMERTGINQTYLPGIQLAAGIECKSDLAQATQGSDCVVIAVPSRFLRAVTSQLATFSGMVVSVTKGIEFETGLTMSGVLGQTMPKSTVLALSGPTLAMEVARKIPAAAVVAHPDDTIATEIQNLFHAPHFRVYTSKDVLGVELGGALKNVIAIAAGINDGLGFGDNTKAALVTRAIVEIRRLGAACGAERDTFAGLSGLGDLVVTCFSRLSRNRGFGERVGRGEQPNEILKSSVTVAEGYPTSESAYQLAKKLGVETPIMDEVYAMLYQNKDVRQAVHDLMSRHLKPEEV